MSCCDDAFVWKLSGGFWKFPVVFRSLQHLLQSVVGWFPDTLCWFPGAFSSLSLSLGWQQVFIS
jgi:hypothetical protein